MTFKPIPQKQAQKIFKELMLNAQNGLRQCWPVPPESGWLYAKAKHASSSKAYDAFKRNWSGSFRSEGECDKPEMQLCFGYKCEADLLLENELFKKCIGCLYSPLIQAIDK